MTLHRCCNLLLNLALAASTFSAELRVSNRPPEPGEVRYVPADGSTNLLNPPSFIWIHEPPADRYTVQWSRTKDFVEPVTVAGLPWNTYTHNAAFTPGTWFWRYQFSAKGATSTWSIARSVVIPTDATPFPMPNVREQRERVPAAHPRLFMRPEDLPRLRELARGAQAERFEKLRQEADRIIAAGPTPEPEHMGSARDKNNKEMVKYWWPNRTQTEKACMEAELIAFVNLLSPDPKYAQAARKWVLYLASWNPDGPTNFKLNCEAGKPMLYRLPRAYDWAYDTLSPEERANVQQVMRRRIRDAWESGEVARGVGHLTRPYNSHGNRVWHKIGEAGIAFLGEIPEAATWLDYAVNKFYAIYPTWSDDDGGWHEGVSYWGGYLSKVVWWLQVANSALQIDGLKKPFFAHVGDFPMYVAPPRSPNSGFGDLSFNPPSKAWGGFMEYFLRAKGSQPDGERAGYWRWWTDTQNMRGQDGILGFLYAVNLPALPPIRIPTNLPPSKVFEGIGVASLHTTLLDSRNDVHLLFKSSPFGTQSHGHNPHNIFQLNAYGDALLTTCVYRDLHGSKFHYNWAHSTVAHNGVLVNGEGQIKHTPAPHGRIVASILTPEWDYLMGDATAAYGARLQRYHRHVAFVKCDPPAIVICDDLAAKEPASFQFMLHALQPFKVDDATASASTERTNAGVAVRYLSPTPLQFRQWDGFQPPPDKPFPNQWHLEATTGKQPSMAMLTVLAPYRKASPVSWQATRIEDDTTLGARLTRDGRQVLVRFPKPGSQAQPSVEIK